VKKLPFISSKIVKKTVIKHRKVVYLMMQHITGISRQELQMSSLEDKISSDNPVRFIDAFVEHISLESVGFTVQTVKSEGRPSFDTKVFLKIYLYGYLNGLRSSRTAKHITNSNKIK
jgi:transposase